MTRAVERCPPEQRFLMVEAIAPSIVAAAPIPASARPLWLSYAYADLPLGTTYDTVFARASREHVATTAIVRAVTQQFGKPFELIPHGWKTLTTVDFPHGVPAMIDALPAAPAWTGRWSLGLCARADLAAILINLRRE